MPNMITEKYLLGRKNNRTTYRLYKQEDDKWFRCGFKKGVFSGWNQCHILPKDLKEVDDTEVFVRLI